MLGRITVSASTHALTGCGLVIEAILERLDVKQTVFRALEDTLARPLSRHQHPRSRPSHMAWRNPATRMKLVEVFPGFDSDTTLVPAMHTLSKALRWS